MLYVNVKVNNVPLKAFVDSGAQMTIMSKSCAERCGIARLIDARFAGMAVGVGQQRILGRVHLCQLEIAGGIVPTSFSVLEDQPMDMILGLDMLKRHQVYASGGWIACEEFDVTWHAVASSFSSSFPPQLLVLSLPLSISPCNISTIVRDRLEEQCAAHRHHGCVNTFPVRG